MEDALIKSLEEIKSFVNRSVIAILTLHLLDAVNFANNRYFSDDSTIEFMNMKIYPAYISFIYGILCFVLIIVVWFQVHRFRFLIKSAEDDKEIGDISKKVRLFPWIASPFHQAKSGLWLFYSILVIASLHPLVSGVAHLFFAPAQLSIPVQFHYQIGTCDVIMFLVTLPLLVLLQKDIRRTRKILGL